MTTSGSKAAQPSLLDKEAAARDKRARRHHREVAVIPRLRAIGSAGLLLAVLIHNWLLLPELDGHLIAGFGAAQLIYWFASTRVLKRHYRDDTGIDLGAVFLAADVVVFVAAIYVSGGERSWLLPLLCVRVADQMATSRRRVLAFATWTAMLHFCLVVYMYAFEQRDFAFLAEFAKVLFLYALNVYLALAAGPSERQRKEAAHATALAHDLIEQLADRTEQLERARLRAESASQAKGTFLANISHELRTPMNAMLGMAELLLEERLPSGQRKMVQTILDSGGSLLRIVNDVLDLSKIEAGELRLTPADLSLERLVESVLSPMHVLASAKGLELHRDLLIDAQQGVRGDELRLRQVLVNLVGNAIKFTERGSVTLRVGEIEINSQLCVHFRVQDTGIGMTETSTREVFDAFKQADESTTRRFGGTGLGLSISKQLVQLMGGDLTVETAPGRGSTFKFELRMERAPLPAAASELDTDVYLATQLRELSPRVLIAEDTAVNRLLLQEWLTRLGCQVTCVDNGAQAVAALTTAHHYSLAFMDWHMPELDGVTATERIREWEQANGYRHTPIIGFTASAFTDETERCRRAGMDGVLIKPVMRGELERTLRTALFGEPVAEAPVQASPVQEPAAPVELRLDPTMLQELQALGAPQYVSTLIDSFSQDSRTRLDQLAAAIEQGDHARARELAHALRGSAASIGGQRFAALAGSLETDARARLPADARARLLQLREEFAALTAELHRAVVAAAASGF